MTKKKPSLTVKTDLSDIFTDFKLKSIAKQTEVKILDALEIVLRQMKVTGFRERTMYDYDIHVQHFAKVTGVKTLADVSTENIYSWLSTMEVSNQTRLTRLKCLKAFLGRCLNNGWYESPFWKNVVIKVDSPIKKGAKESDIFGLLAMLDLKQFIELRDATAILLMYQTGIRIGTIGQLSEKHVDLESQTLKVDGGLLKNHEQIHLPFDDVLTRLLTALIEHNKIIRLNYNVKNDFLFISQHGRTIANTPTNNLIRKRLQIYSKRYGFENLNPHAIRRGFAKDLLNKGFHIAIISKALGHADISTTTRYLHFDKEEVANELRKRF